MTLHVSASEARRNLRRHPGEVATTVAAIAAASALIAVLGQYWQLVDRALDVTRRDPTSVGQASARPVLVIGGCAGALLLAGAMVWLAAARRRRADRQVLERLGAGPELTSRPALIEGLTLGLAGGVLGAALGLALAPAITSFERASMSSTLTIHVSEQTGGGGGIYGRARVETYRIPADEIGEGTASLAGVAIATLLIGTGLGASTAATTLRRSTRPPA